jgi:hypothetical protein
MATAVPKYSFPAATARAFRGRIVDVGVDVELELVEDVLEVEDTDTDVVLVVTTESSTPCSASAIPKNAGLVCN